MHRGQQRRYHLFQDLRPRGGGRGRAVQVPGWHRELVGSRREIPDRYALAGFDPVGYMKPRVDIVLMRCIWLLASDPQGNVNNVMRVPRPPETDLQVSSAISNDTNGGRVSTTSSMASGDEGGDLHHAGNGSVHRGDSGIIHQDSTTNLLKTPEIMVSSSKHTHFLAFRQDTHALTATAFSEPRPRGYLYI